MAQELGGAPWWSQIILGGDEKGLKQIAQCWGMQASLRGLGVAQTPSHAYSEPLKEIITQHGLERPPACRNWPVWWHIVLVNFIFLSRKSEKPRWAQPITGRAKRVWLRFFPGHSGLHSISGSILLIRAGFLCVLEDAATTLVLHLEEILGVFALALASFWKKRPVPCRAKSFQSR